MMVNDRKKPKQKNAKLTTLLLNYFLLFFVILCILWVYVCL
eukprot:UN05720